MSKPVASPSPSRPEQVPLGLVAIFGSTFLQLMGYFMLTPLLVLRLKDEGLSTALTGVFVTTGWLGVFCMTPFASMITQHLGRRSALWLSAGIPVITVAGFVFTDALLLWFAFVFIEGMSAGLRWVLAEALVAEFSAPLKRGRNVGLFETMIGLTFVLGPALLVWIGPGNRSALSVVLGLTVLGFLWTLLTPRLPTSPQGHQIHVGLGGVWQALRAHPLIMTVGFVGGFFESGITSILPLYGLSLGMGAAASALLVSASGLGSALMMLPAGMLADRMAAHPQQRFGNGLAVRLRLMQMCALTTLIATLAIPFVAGTPWLASPVAFLWGGAGGCLYTMAMIDIGSREQGITLVNSTAMLVLSYTLGGVAAPSLGSAALQWAPTLGFPALLLLVAAPGWWLLRRARLGHASGQGPV